MGLGIGGFQMKSLLSLIFWGIIFLIVWTVTWPFKGNKTNCFVWAVEKWEKEGGYLVIRWCQADTKFKWPHFLWLPNQHSQLKHAYPKDDIGEGMHYWFEPRTVTRDDE